MKQIAGSAQTSPFCCWGSVSGRDLLSSRILTVFRSRNNGTAVGSAFAVKQLKVNLSTKRIKKLPTPRRCYRWWLFYDL
ncbi:hypothetical protein AMECASPLE_033636 [Ameca splendens]|uniref:Uncharacterized protein n=2 Tax=Goodeidae TaxID=28758 RepID=A0ABU7A7V6_9TELE|nr:hypothetical protein [Ataeniobius toweri]